MRAVVQRVSSASVEVEGQTIGAIGAGLVVLLGVTHTDDHKAADWLAEKVANLRIFEDDQGKMNRSLLEVGGSALVISQFTVYGDCSHGRRPGFTEAAPPAQADELYSYFVGQLKAKGLEVGTGRFQTEMLVHIDNHGPVTIIIDSKI